MSQLLSIVAAHQPPFIFADNERVANARFYGLLPDLITVLLSYAGLDNRTVSYYQVQGSGGSQMDNGTWTGVMGELTEGRADLAAFPLSLVQPRPQYVEMSYNFVNDGGIGILVPSLEKPADTLSFLQPFQWQLWLAILGAVLGVAILGSLVSRISPLGQYELKRLRRLDVEDAPVAEYVTESANDSSLMVAASTQLGQMPQPRSRSWANRVLVLAYGAFAIIILSSYTASLASFLTVQQLTPQVDNLVDLLRAGGSFAVTGKGATEAYFRTALDPVAAALMPRMRVLKDSESGVDLLRAGEVAAYLTDVPTLRHFAQQLPCDVAVSGIAFGPGSITLGMPKGSPLLPLLNEALLKVMSNGVLDQLNRKWTQDANQCSADAKTADSHSLDLGSTAGLFYLLFLAAAVALLMAGIERLLPHAVNRWPALSRAQERMQGWLHRCHGRVLRDPHVAADKGFSKSALEISRSFHHRGLAAQRTAAAAAAAVAIADSRRGKATSLAATRSDSAAESAFAMESTIYSDDEGMAVV